MLLFISTDLDTLPNAINTYTFFETLRCHSLQLTLQTGCLFCQNISFVISKMDDRIFSPISFQSREQIAMIDAVMDAMTYPCSAEVR